MGSVRHSMRVRPVPWSRRRRHRAPRLCRLHGDMQPSRGGLSPGSVRNLHHLRDRRYLLRFQRRPTMLFGAVGHLPEYLLRQERDDLLSRRVVRMHIGPIRVRAATVATRAEVCVDGVVCCKPGIARLQGRLLRPQPGLPQRSLLHPKKASLRQHLLLRRADVLCRMPRRRRRCDDVAVSSSPVLRRQVYCGFPDRNGINGKCCSFDSLCGGVICCPSGQDLHGSQDPQVLSLQRQDGAVPSGKRHRALLRAEGPVLHRRLLQAGRVVQLQGQRGGQANLCLWPAAGHQVSAA